VRAKVAAPAAPTNVKAVYKTVTGGAVELSWTDDDPSVTGYTIERSSDGGKTYETVGTVGVEAKSYTDVTLSRTNIVGPWDYKVIAVSALGTATSEAVSVQAIGGPDVTEHLKLFREDLNRWYGLLTLAQQKAFRNEWITSPGQASLAFFNFFPFTREQFLINKNDIWDITQLALQQVVSTNNLACLPNGVMTVTVAGRVYRQQEVNYWLYGCIMDTLGYGKADCAALIKWYRGADGYVGRLDWFYAGYNNDMNYPGYNAIKGVLPAPQTDDPGKLNAHAGDLRLGLVWTGWD